MACCLDDENELPAARNRWNFTVGSKRASITFAAEQRSGMGHGFGRYDIRGK